jgi:hypothetical protein
MVGSEDPVRAVDRILGQQPSLAAVAQFDEQAAT